MDFCRLRHDCLKQVAQAKDLSILRLKNTAISDAGVKHLTALQKIEHLDLSGTQISDAAADDIAQLNRESNFQELNRERAKS